MDRVASHVPERLTVPEPVSVISAPLDATIRSARQGVGVDDRVGPEPHSLRRTKAAQIYRKTGNLRAVQLLLGHTKMDSTVRYLGVELEDALSIAEKIEL